MLGFIAIIYFGITLSVSAFRIFWFDEPITFYIARLNNFRAIWDVLYRGADPNPPLMHLLVMWSTNLFGNGQIAVRLPAVLIQGLGIWCLSVAALLTLAVCFVWAMTRNGLSISELVEQREAFYYIINHTPKTGTVAFSDSLLALPIAHYAPPDLARRVVMPLDLEMVQKYKHDDSPEQNLKNGGSIFPLRSVPISANRRKSAQRRAAELRSGFSEILSVS